MSCVDPRERDVLASLGDEGREFERHLARCPECAAERRAIAGLVGGTGPGPHPAADALVAWDEDPARLSDGSRAWIGRHLASCAPCCDALAGIPRMGYPIPTPAPTGLADRFRRGVLPALAAAGWIVAAVLAVRPFADAGAPARTFLTSQTVTLAQARGEAWARLLPVDVVRFACVLGEEVRVGQKLRVRVEDAGGRAVFDADATVDDLTESGWPVIAMSRAALPPGKLVLRVRAPSGSEIVAFVEG